MTIIDLSRFDAFDNVTLRMSPSRYAEVGTSLKRLNGHTPQNIDAWLRGRMEKEWPAKGDVVFEMTARQYAPIPQYISSGVLSLGTPFLKDSPSENDAALAFSYGASLSANKAIADNIIKITSLGPNPVQVYAQWEIHDLLKEMKADEMGMDLHRISIKPQVSAATISDLDMLQLEVQKMSDNGFSLFNATLFCVTKEEAAEAIGKTMDSMRAKALEGLKEYLTEFCDAPYNRSSHPLARAIAQSAGYADPELFMALGQDRFFNFYVTSDGVVNSFKSMTGARDVFVFGQSWHAPRIVGICRKEGLNVKGGSFVDQFSTYDEQEWVKDPLRWVIKEAGTMQRRADLAPHMEDLSSK